MSYLFGSVLYRTSQQAHRAMANEWITAGGDNSDRDVEQALLDFTDSQLAAEAVGGWGLTDSSEYGEPLLEWFEHEELVAAFRGLRNEQQVL